MENSKFQIKRAAYESNPDGLWDEYEDFLARVREPVDSEILRVLYRAYWYLAEIMNGGHLQFLVNCSQYLDETIESLSALKALEQIAILERAKIIFLSSDFPSIHSISDYTAEAKKGKFKMFDDEFDSCEVDLYYYMDIYLRQNFEELVEIVD